MTHRASCRLPKKPSKLIELALDDLAKAERSAKYIVAMNSWHEPELHGYNPRTCKIEVRPCEVCLAGSVMAFSLNVPATAEISPYSYPEGVQKALLALDNFRMGKVGEALYHLKTPATKITAANKAFGHVSQYEWDLAEVPMVEYSPRNSAKFKQQMRDMAKKLASIGL